MKLKTKLSTLLLGITSIFALTAAIVTNPNSGNAIEAKAESQTYQHIFTAKPSTGDNIKLSGVSWKISATNLGSYNSQNYAGVQIGASGKNGQIILTSSTEWNYNKGTQISEVRLWLNTGGSLVTPTVTIGGVNATSDGTVVVKNSKAGKDYTKATKVTFTPSETSNTGFVVIDVTSANAGYICAIEIDAIESTTTSATLQSISATSTQTEVYQNEELDKSAITVTGQYDDGSKKVLSSGWTVECDTSVVATGVTATVKYEGFKAEFTIDVIEMPSSKTLQLVTSTSELSTGDKIVLVVQKDGKYYANGVLSSDYLKSINVTTAINNSIILLDDFELLTVVKTASSYKFVFEDGALLFVTAAKKLTNKDTGTGDTEFTIAINAEDNKATIQSKTETFGRFLYNSGSPRFTTYTSDTSASMLLPYIYKLTDGNDAGEYADEFLSTVTCDGQGSITAVEGFWNTESTKFNALSAADKKVFSLAEASESGSVEKCVNRYDAIVSKYGTTVYNDFMSRGIVSPSRAIFKPNIVEDAPITEIIVIASISAVTLIGLFAISKKRKEN